MKKKMKPIQEPDENDLTADEKKMVQLVAAGQKQEHIAFDMNLSKSTLQSKLNAIIHRFGCVNSTNLVYKLTKEGIL